MKTISAMLLALCSAPLCAADWPQFLGPKRDGHSPETGLLKMWPKKGPTLAWTFKNAGVGYSSPAVVGDRLYICGGRNHEDQLIALDAVKGMELWKLKIGPLFDFKGNQWGKGPRCTPSVADGLVYALGGAGDFVCANAKTGVEVWRVNMLKDLGGEVNNIQFGGPKGLAWGYSWSPLVDGDKVICYPGGAQGALAALDCKKGTVIWRSKALPEGASYASPIVADIGGVRQYIVLHNNGLSGVDAKTGALLWTWQKDPPYGDVLIPTPLYHDGFVYTSACYKPATCALIEITKAGDKFKAKNIYNTRTSKVMKNPIAGSVLVDGHVYGYSEGKGWMCQDLKTGRQVWADKSFDAGSVTYAEGQLYCYGEDSGTVVLADASTKGWNEKSRFALPAKTTMPAPSGRNWTPPVIANGHLFLRDQELLFCYEIK